MAASTITRVVWTDGAAGTVINNARKNSDIYDKVDEMFAGAGAYTTFAFGGAVQSDGQPRASAYNSATQSINDSADTALTLDSEDFDVGTMHSTVSNTSRMTVPSGQGGLYWIKAQAAFAANATGVRLAYLRKNGTTALAQQRLTNAGGAHQTILEVSTLVVLAAADYVELIGYQESGGALNTGSATRAGSNILQAVRLW